MPITKEQIHKMFDEQFPAFNTWLKGDKGSAGDSIKSFYDQIISQVLREVRPDRKSNLVNVLEGRNDELYDKNGMDGVIGYNSAIAELDKKIKDLGY